MESIWLCNNEKQILFARKTNLIKYDVFALLSKITKSIYIVTFINIVFSL